MTRERVHDLMENELRCVQRGNYCDRDCAKCPLVKDDKELIEAYGYVIKALEQEPCEDAISRNMVLSDVKSGMIRTIDGENWKRVNDNVRDIQALPPVTPQPKIGKWIVDGSVDCYLDKVKCHCSECGKKKEFPANYDHIKQKLSVSYKYPEFIDNYCPNCGAKMVEPQERSEKG